MSGLIGNQNGVGHGRPPKEGYSNEEIISLGEELLSWLKYTDENEIEVVHLSEWFSEIKGIAPKYFYDDLSQRIHFREYYERAMMWMGKKLLKNRELPTAYGSRFLGIYQKDVKDHEHQLMKDKVDYEFKKKEEASLISQKSPNDSEIDFKHENMLLKAQLDAANEIIKKNNLNDNQPKTE